MNVTCSRKQKAAITCTSCLLIFGITALVLGLMGYFTVKEPCVEVGSFDILAFDMKVAEEADEGDEPGGFLDFISGVTSQLGIPSQAAMTIRLVIEVNNTNTYGIKIEQLGEGSVDLVDKEGGEDLPIGTWKIPTSTLGGKTSNDIQLQFNATLDLLGVETIDLVGELIAGEPVAFRVEGSLKGSGWLPGATAKIDLACIATVDNVLDVENGVTAECQGQEMSSADGVDSSCLV